MKDEDKTKKQLINELAELCQQNKELRASEIKRKLAAERIRKLGRLKEELLSSGSLHEKLKKITNGVVEILHADFSRIWITKPGDLCDSGCMHVEITEGPHICHYRDRCLHLIASSGRYTHTDGKVHRRVPFGCYKIGRVAAAEDPKFITSDVTNDPRVHDHNWAKKLDLVSFAGYRLLSEVSEPIGVLALFSKRVISPDEDALIEDIANTAAQVIQTTTADEELKKTKDYLDNVIESSLEGIVVSDSMGYLTRVNNSFLKLIGYNEEEILGKHISEFTPYEEGVYDSTTGEMVEIDEKFIADAAEIAGNKLFEEGKITNWDSYYLRRDQKIVPVEINITYLYNKNGETIGSVGINRDITERRQIERVLRESHQELEEKVEKRTATLKLTNEQLQQEIAQRKKIEQKLITYQNQLKSLASQITLSEERERRRLADYLHDEIGQQLIGVKIKLKMLEDSLSSHQHSTALSDTIHTISGVIDNARSLTYEISPPILHQLGLEAALEWLAEQTEEQYNINVTCEDDNQVKPLDADVKILLFQAVRELLINVAKHAQAHNARVSLKKGSNHIRICVEDDGIGFTHSGKDSSREKNKGFGLFSITERLEQLGGHLEIASKPDCGTHITLIAPLMSKVGGL
jgi:signal transduction histidine kinase